MTTNKKETGEEMLFKIILIGDSSSGKTNILSRYLNNIFVEESKPTIGVEFGNKSFIINEDTVNAQIWDTAGTERCNSVTSAYYKGAVGALVTYDITRKESFDNVEKWITDLKANADEKIRIILVGNKTDLDSNRQVTKEEGEQKAKDLGVSFIETSALSGNNIEAAFDKLINEVYQECHQEFDSFADVNVDVDVEEVERKKTLGNKGKNTNTTKKKCCLK